MKRKQGIALLLAALLLASLLGACGKQSASDTGTAPAAESPAEGESPAAPEPDEYSLPREPGTRQLSLYWNHPSADYAKCDV